MPGSKVKMVTLGGDANEVVAEAKSVELPKDHNHGRHIIYTGGRYDSYLYVPVIPKKQ